MESHKSDEMMGNAITKLMNEDEVNDKTSPSHRSHVAVDGGGGGVKPGGGDRHQMQGPSNLLNQLESSKEDSHSRSESKEEGIVEDPLSSEVDENKKTQGQNEVSNEEIIKELKEIKRQNTITQYLLTAMIVITLGWQLSEVSLIFMIKEGLTHPMKSVGGLFKVFFKKGPDASVQDVMRNASEMHEQVWGQSSMPGLKIPELKRLGLPGFDSSDDEE